MSRRFERFAGSAEAWIIGMVIFVLAVAFFISRLRG